MLTIGDTIDIHPEEALAILQQHTNEFGVFINYDRLLDIQSMAIECQKPFLRIMRLMADNEIVTANHPQVLTSIYVQRLGVPQSMMVDAGGDFSSGSEVRDRIIESDKTSDSAKMFAKIHHCLAYYAGILKNLNQYSTLPLCNKRDKYGNRMLLARPTYGMLSTYRLQASNPSIQNIGREFPELITEPEKFTLLSTDSGQIEPRIMYSHFIKDSLIKTLILLYNDAYYAMLHFIMMSVEEEIKARRMLESVERDSSIPEREKQAAMISKIEKKPLTKDLRNALKLAALAAGYGSGLQGKVVPYAKEYVEKINNHPLRKKWQRDVEDFVAAGGETFYTPFGLPITPDETDKYKKGTVGWTNHVIRCGINNPIQATASQLMCESVMQANRMLRRTRSHICLYKHDEGKFYVHDRDEDLIDELKEITAYKVKDWIPIYSDPCVGVKQGSGFGVGFDEGLIETEIERISKKFGLSA